MAGTPNPDGAQTSINIHKFETSNFFGEFDSRSGVLRSLRSSLDPSFDFVPSDIFEQRNEDGNYHTGDITMHWRLAGADIWQALDTSCHRNLSTCCSFQLSGSGLLTSDITSVSPALGDTLKIARKWQEHEGDLVLMVTITNTHIDSAIELGAFGLPIEFNSIFTGRTRDDTSNKCVLIDPYVGQDAGYVQITRLTGTGPCLVITPFGKNSKLESWRYLEELRESALKYQSHTFEGFYAWQILTKAYAEDQWKHTVPWNVPTSQILLPGQTIDYGLRFTVVSRIEDIESAVASTGTPLAVGLPGYILPADTVGNLYINYSKADVLSVSTFPQDSLKFSVGVVRERSWKAFQIETTPVRGRIRVEIRYDDGKLQTIHYFITDPAPETLAKHARFLFTEQWLEEPDLFGRAPGIVTYDFETRKKVLEERRVWIAGLQDEGGAASWVAAAMKIAFFPELEEVSKLERMATKTVWGRLQYSTRDGKFPVHAVKRSLFFYDSEFYNYDPATDWTGWASWTQAEAREVWRPYNYVWVSGIYWALYRAEKLSPGILKHHDALWYLEKAFRTLETCYAFYPDGEPLVEYRDVGLMGEIIWHEVMRDLERENMNDFHAIVQSIMRDRQEVWAQTSDPFGSEAPWDSTGQEAVYLWSKTFKDTATVAKTLRSIRGYMPTVAHWAYNGNARRYWDFDVAGKLARIERQVHHYGSPLNAIPLLDSYQSSVDPSSRSAIHDLRVGYGGWFGALSNVNDAGFASQAFHARPDTMKWDAFSSDYGAGLPGHMIMSMTTLFDHPDFGMIAMAGNAEEQGDGKTRVLPRDTVRRRIYVAPISLSFVVSTGIISEFTYDSCARAVSVSIVAGAGPAFATAEWRDTAGSGVKLVQPTQNERKQYGAVALVVNLPTVFRFRVGA